MKMHFIFFDFALKTDSTDVVLNDEAEAYKWVTLNEALTMNVDAYTINAINELMQQRKNTV